MRVDEIPDQAPGAGCEPARKSHEHRQRRRDLALGADAGARHGSRAEDSGAIDQYPGEHQQQHPAGGTAERQSAVAAERIEPALHQG